MSKISTKNFLENINSRQLLLFGFLVIFIYNLPYIILGENSWFNFGYDSLDSNVIWFKILVESGNIFSSNDSVLYPALSALPRLSYPGEFSIELWLYYFLNPASAYIANIILIQAIAFAGVFLLLHEIKRNGSIYLIFLIALIYSMLPFWPHAGLSVAGLPLVYYGYLQVNKKPFLAYLILLVYILYSSFVITGLFLIAILLLIVFYQWIKNKELNKQGVIYIAVMLFLFLVTNYRLILSTFSDSFTSHRVDVVFAETSFLDSVSMFMALLVKEYGHNFIGKSPIVVILIVFLLVEFFSRRKEFKSNIQLFNVILLIVFLSFLSALFQNTAFRDFYISIISFLRTIQLQRFYWLLPPLFYILLFLVLDKLVVKKKGVYIVSLILLFQFSYVASRNATFRQIIKTKILGSESGMITFKEFYSPDLYAEINQYIGKTQDTYRVASIGLQPAAALYNGFYTIDGYFPNYPKKNKDKFFKLVEPELNKSEILYNFFDKWGSVCIIQSFEIIEEKYPNGYIIPVINKVDSMKSIHNLSLNAKELKDLNCQYIFSSVIIENSEEIDLKLLKTFDKNNVPYIIHLYAVDME